MKKILLPIAILAILSISFYQFDFLHITNQQAKADTQLITHSEKSNIQNPIKNTESLLGTNKLQDSIIKGENQLAKAKVKTTVEERLNLNATYQYKSIELQKGSIGMNQRGAKDNPRDNVFHFDIKHPYNATGTAHIEYDIYGVKDYTSVTKGINDNLSYGGMIVQQDTQWSHQSEAISIQDLKRGHNVIRFSVPEKANYGYQIKNIRLVVNNQPNGSKQLIVNQPNNATYFNKYGYVSGFVIGEGADKATIFVGDKKINHKGGVFETLAQATLNTQTETESNPQEAIENDSSWTTVVMAIFEDGTRLSKEVTFNKTSDYDYVRVDDFEYERTEKLFTTQDDIKLSYNSFSFEGEKGSIKEPKNISVSNLRSFDMPEMGSGMTNVTGESRGFRLLPHGTQFSKMMRIGIPYDSISIPMGYKPSDIRSYYFDENTNSWAELAYDTVDSKLCIVYSYTNHFTDYINGILKVPEAPQTSAYTPTSLSDMKAANPLQGINMMSPPSANNSGSANTGIAIQIPAGRQGMQPNLSINYSSDGGNGWMGVGWDLSIPSIDVETRWGVPRYSSSLETESYLMAGEQLTPMIHRSGFTPREDNKTFYERVKGNFNKIKRYGTSPTSYYWVVTDRNGTKYYYGAYSDPSIVDSNLSVDYSLVLASSDNNIAHWALAEVRDLHGNFVKYHYQKISHTGVSGGSLGTQLYPQEITYTGHDTTEGLYRIEFDIVGQSNEYIRKDILISGRNGFKEVTAHLLRRIKVFYDKDFIRQYNIMYRAGAFDKTVICQIVDVRDSDALIMIDGFTNNSRIDLCGELDAVGISVHKFEYYEEDSIGFGSPINIDNLDGNYYDDGDLDLMGGLVGVSDEYTLGRSNSLNWDIGGQISIGGGPAAMLKSLSASGGYNFSRKSDNTKMVLMDIDGDGLNDKVFFNPSSGYQYRKAIYNGQEIIFENTINSLANLPGLNHAYSNNHNFGLSIQVAIANASGGITSTNNFTDMYFSDVNADGLPDLIDNADVYINRLNAQGYASFSKDNSDTLFINGSSCNYILRTGEVDEGVYTPFKEDNINYTRDAVIVWVAPYDGNVRINAPIQLIEDISYSRMISKTVDGVGWMIQHNDTIIDFDTINKNDYTLKQLSYSVPNIQKGDKFYFRLESGQTRKFDKVKWTPQIYYTDGQNADINNMDADGKRIKLFDYGNDMLAYDKQSFVAPFEGQIKLRGSIQSTALSDTIRFKIFKNYTLIHSQVFVDNADFNHSFNLDLNVLEGDKIRIVAQSNTNVDFNAIKHDILLLYYQSSVVSVDTNIESKKIEMKQMVEFNLFQKPLSQTIPYYSSTTGYHTFTPHITGFSTFSGIITFAVKKRHEILGEITLNYVNGLLISSSSTSLSIYLSNNDTVFYEYYCDKNITNTAVNYDVLINSVTHQAAMHVSMPDAMWKFGNLYRGWGQFSYNGNSFYVDYTGVLSYSPINQNELHLPALINNTSSITINTNTMGSVNDILSQLSFNGQNNPLETPFSMMPFSLDSMYWHDFAQQSFINKEIVSNSYTLSSTDSFPDFPFNSMSISNGIEVRTVKKMTQEYNIAGGYSISSGLSFGQTINEGSSSSEIEFIDMNGDRYPDVISRDKIQFTKPQGGLIGSSVTPADYGGIQTTGFSGSGQSMGVNLPIAITLESGDASNSTGKQISIKVTMESSNIGGISGNFYENNSSSSIALMDVNGDGLLDRFNQDNANVQLNYGYGFGIAENWGVSNVNIGQSNAKGGSYGITNSVGDFDVMSYSFSGGVSAGESENNSNLMVVDMNGDGLQDIISISNNNMYVSFNNGSDFTSPSLWSSQTDIQKSKSVNAAINSAGSFGITWAGVAKLVFTASGSVSDSKTFEKSRLLDYNNDGYPDLVTATNNGYEVRYSRLGKLNTLKKVTTPTDASFSMEYELTTSSYNMPNRSWVLNNVQIFDGLIGDGADTMEYAFEYRNPYYDRFERTSYGYDTVISRQINHYSANKYTYRTTVESFINNDFNFKGYKTAQSLLDSNDRTYTRTTYTYSGSDCDGPIGYDFPALLATDNYFYEGQSNYQMHTRQEFYYDNLANVDTVIDKRDMAIAEDDIISYITYSIDLPTNQLSIIDSIRVMDANTTYRTRAASYNVSLGELSSMSIDNNGNISTYYFNYDAYGNMISMVLPENSNQEAMFYQYTYDPVIHTLPIKVKDGAFGYFSETVYDYRLQVPILTTDIAGNNMEFVYSLNGRLSEVRGPNEIANGDPYSIKFDYFEPQGFGPTIIPWSKTTYFDPLISGNTFSNFAFTDGLGRPIQSQTKAILPNPSTGNYEERLIVSGKTIMDEYGRAIYSYYPTTKNMSIIAVFSTAVDNINPTRVYYDVMDRKTKIRMPDNTINQMSYGFGNDAFGKKQFMQKTVDAIGTTFYAYTNAMGKQTTLRAPLGTITKFVYNTLGELLHSFDPQGYQTTYTYDNVGQLMSRVHPDAGTTSYTYDNAGNLMTVQTANLAAQSSSIAYDYEYNRLKQVTYPNSVGNDVYYEYGGFDPQTQLPTNQTGRLVKMQDASGVQTFNYGRMGELIENIHTFVVPGGDPYTFAMQWSYDSWNRTSSVDYPDGETVEYGYDDAGKLTSMSGVKGSNNYSYVDNIKYDKFGSQTKIVYGNGTSAKYTYDATTRRLANLQSYDAQSAPMQNINYQYYNNGNIATVANSANAISNIGGISSDSHYYDSLSRLTASYGVFTDFNNNNYSYLQTMTYSASGNITEKTMQGSTLLNGAVTSITYDNLYQYATSGKPHAVSSIKDANNNTTHSMSWDANGNMTNLNIPAQSLNRSICWDEENRLTIAKDDQANLNHYIYNAGGERVWKLTGAIERMSINGKDFFDQSILNDKTLYTSPYMVVTDREYTKHYYIESQRVTSKLGGGMANNLVDPTSGTLDFIEGDATQLSTDLIANLQQTTCVDGMAIEVEPQLKFIEESIQQDDDETEQYFYHGDHLGSSSWITNASGNVDQHLAYMPFGESFIDQRASGHDIRFKFTGKERDSKTGFDYFGARYYASDLSVWLSVDPLASAYASTSPYMYVLGNPINITDPDGRWSKFGAWIRSKFDKDAGEIYKSKGGDDDDWGYNRYTYDKNGKLDGWEGVFEKERKRGGERMLGNNSQQDESIPSGDPGHNKGFIDVRFYRHPFVITRLLYKLIKYFDLSIDINIPNSKKIEKQEETSSPLPDNVVPVSIKGTDVVAVDSNRPTRYHVGQYTSPDGRSHSALYENMSYRDSVNRAKRENR